MSYTLTLTIQGSGFDGTPIPIESFSFGEQTTVTVGGGGTTTTSKPAFAPVQISKRLDANSVALYRAAFAGTPLQTVTLSLTKTGSSAPDATYTLTTGFVTAVADGGNGHDGLFPLEQINFAFQRVQIVAFGNTVTYDISVNKVS